MADAGGIRAGRAYVELGAQDRGLVAGLRRAQQHLQRFGAGVRAMGQRMQALGSAGIKGGMLGALGLGFTGQQFSEFENHMARVKALMIEGGEGAGVMKGLTAEAMRLGATTSFSAGQAAEAMAIFAVAGLRSNEIMKAAGATLNLAAASQMGLADAASIVSNLMSSQALAASDLVNVTDMLTRAAASANTTVQDLGEAFKHGSATARGFGVALPEALAAVTLMQGSGLAGEMAGTGLRGVLNALVAPTEQSAKAMADLGFQVQKTAAGGLDLFATLALLERRLSPDIMTRAQQLTKVFPDNRAASAALTLLGKGSGELQKLTRSLEKAGGTSARIAATQLDTLSGSLELLKSAAEGLVLTIGSGLAPMFRDFAGALTGLTNILDRLAQSNPQLFAGLARGTAAALAGGAAFLVLGKALSFAFSWAGLATGALAGVGVVLWRVSDVFRTFPDLAQQAWRGVADSLMAGDLNLAWQVTLAGLNQGWLMLQLTLREFWDETVSYLKWKLSSWTSTAWSGLQSGWAHAMAWMGDQWDALVGSIKKGAIEMGADIKKAVLPSWMHGGIDAATAASKAGIDAQTAAAAAARRQALGERLDEIEEARQSRQQGIDTQYERDRADRAAARQGDWRGVLGAAQAHLGGLTERAAGKRWLADQGTAWGKVGESLLDRWWRGLGKGGAVAAPSREALAQQMGKVEAAGTFSAHAAAGMGVGSSLEQQQLDEQRRQTDLLRQVRNGIDDIGRL